MAQNSVKALVLTTFDSASLSDDYQVINADGFEGSPFLIIITNDSDESCTISFDGITDNDYILSASTREIPTQTNAQPNAYTALWSKYTKVYVKGTAGTGSIALSGYYV